MTHVNNKKNNVDLSSTFPVSDFTKEELRVFKKLSTPQKIQDYLNAIPINFETAGDTCYSPRMVIRNNLAHCAEGAVFAATCLWYHGRKPLLMDLTAATNDYDHVVALFTENGYWGAISKTNHAVLRYREPVYSTIRELALSYFHEYFTDTGKKTLRSYSVPYDLSKRGMPTWMTSKEYMWDLINDLDNSKHYPIRERMNRVRFRKADPIEIAVGKITEWQRGRSKKTRKHKKG